MMNNRIHCCSLYILFVKCRACSFVLFGLLKLTIIASVAEVVADCEGHHQTYGNLGNVSEIYSQSMHIRNLATSR